MEEERKSGVAQILIDKVVYIFEIHDTFVRLFSESNSQILSNTANHFFSLINHLLQIELLLELAKITDPKKQAGRANLSVSLLYDELLDGNNEEASKLVHEMTKFRKKIEDARNRVLSHNDLETFEGNRLLGAFEEHELSDFMNSLHAFADLISLKFRGHILGEIVTTIPGDDLDLMKWLRRGIAFQKIFDEETDTERKAALFQTVRNV